MGWIMRKHVKNAEQNTKVLLNVPLISKENDWIGIESYVDELHQVIQSGAQVIGITSDFGTGKSSVISLFKEKYVKDNRNKRFFLINLWETIDQTPENLHKSFLYHVINQIDARKGGYISKRLSKNYGLLSLQSSSFFKNILVIIMGLALVIGIFIKNNADFVKDFFSITNAQLVIAERASFLAVFILAVLVLFNIDIVFSTGKSEGKREIDTNTLIDYFNTEVLRRGFKKQYIFVIEDLDRTQDAKAVMNFLKELRRYYLTDKNWQVKFRNNEVVFLICLKPEALLEREIKENSSQDELLKEEDNNKSTIYNKVFDYILNLRPINIDNYDEILNGFLTEVADRLVQLKIVKDCQSAHLKQIPEMGWIIRGKELGIREIKTRINMSLSLYENLISKFSGEDISFEKCVVVVYLMTEFADDYYRLKDRSLDSILEKYLSGNLQENVDEWDFLNEEQFSKEFKKEIYELLVKKLIDVTYRTYFYNYPKNSRLYNVCEMNVYNSIVYNEAPTNKDDYQKWLEQTDKHVIEDAFGKIRTLNMRIPGFTLEYEQLAKIILDGYANELLSFFSSLPFDQLNYKKTTQIIVGFIENFCRDDFKSLSNQVGEILIKNIDDFNILLYVRTELCRVVKSDIIHAKMLYGDNTPLITEKEIDYLQNASIIIQLLNYDSVAEQFDICKRIHQCIVANTKCIESSYDNFYLKMFNYQPEYDWVNLLKEYCQVTGAISNELLEFVNLKVEAEEWSVQDYIDIISRFDTWNTRELQLIEEYNWTGGLSKILCEKLYNEGYFKEYVANIPVDELNLNDNQVQLTLRESIEWFIEHNKEGIMSIRYRVLKDENLISQFRFLFERPCPVLAEKEIFMIRDYQVALSLLDTWLLDKAEIDYVAKYLSCKYRNPKETYLILSFIFSHSEESKYFFYKLNRDNISYSRMAAANRKKIEDKMFPILGIDGNVKEIVNFLLQTKRANQTLEKDLYVSLKSNEECRKKYLSFVNELSKINATTLKNIINLKLYCQFSAVVEKRLLENKNYDYYIYSRFYNTKSFVLEEDKIDILWDEYVKFYHSNYDSIVKAMSQNDRFLSMLLEKETYLLPDCDINRYCVARQTVALLNHVFDVCSDSQLIKYLSSIKGFSDYDAAHYFVERIQGRKVLLVNESIYNNCHEKIVNSGLQGWYTRLKKKQ